MSDPSPPARRATLAVCAIVLNEERRLPAALASISDIADEIIVVDAGSTDRTVQVATAAGARVIDHPWEGFARQRNVALDAATADWVLELDADERVTPRLAEEIRAFLALPPPPEVRMGVMPMRHRFLGRLLGPAGRYPFYRNRLMRRGAYRHDETREVHEGLRAAEPPWVFLGDLEHELAADIGEAMRDTWNYARLTARSIGSVTGRDLAVGVVGRPAVKFLYVAFVLGGVRDGGRGLTRLALECCGDAATWLLARRHSSAASRRGRPARHFGRLEDVTAPAHVLAVGDPTGHWPALEAAARSGALVSLVCDAAHAPPRLAGGERLRVRPAPDGLLGLVRGVDAEAQICPVSARVALDRRGAVALRLAPEAGGELVDPRHLPTGELAGEAA